MIVAGTEGQNAYIFCSLPFISGLTCGADRGSRRCWCFHQQTKLYEVSGFIQGYVLTKLC
jgi:hypothetical protein